MAWTMSGHWYEVCSCKMVCRCNFGPAEPDQEWCSGMFVFDVRGGESGGVDLAGAKLAVGAQLPGDFLGGIDVARLYVDEAVTDQQRSELEAIFQGRRGGLWEGVNAMIKSWLPTRTVAVQLGEGDSPAVSVGDVASFSFTPVTTEDGRRSVVTNAPIAAAFGVDTLELATASGGSWDPDLRQWDSLGYGARVPFDWSF